MTAPLQTQYVGPAKVLSVDDGAVRVLLLGHDCVPEGEARGAVQDTNADQSTAIDPVIVDATWAVPFPYNVKRDDRVLVVAVANAFMVIGILQGRGVAALVQAAGKAHESPRGVRIEAGRKLRLVAGRALDVVSGGVVRREMTISGWRRLERHAERIHWLASELTQHYHGAVTKYVGQHDEVVERDWLHRAGAFALTVAQVVKLNGKNIKVG